MDYEQKALKATEYADYELFSKTISEYNNNWTVTTTSDFDGYEPTFTMHDAVVNDDDNKPLFVEIKSRPKYKIDSFKTFIIDEYKVNYLADCIKEGQCYNAIIASIYIESDIMCLWSVSDLEKWNKTSKIAPTSTMLSYGRKTNKMFYELPIEDAVKYKCDCTHYNDLIEEYLNKIENTTNDD